jgi:hypothetical protein
MASLVRQFVSCAGLATLSILVSGRECRAEEHDLKPYLGRDLANAIKTVTPSVDREHVTTDRLTIDDRGTAGLAHTNILIY